MTSPLGPAHLIAAGSLFALLSVLSLLWFPGYYISLMSLCAVVGLGFLVNITGFQYCFPALLASLPISISIEIGGGANLLFPSELLMATLVVAVFFHWVKNPSAYWKLLRHPATLSLCGYMFFMVIAACFSEMSIVSVKAVLVRSLYVIAFYFGAYIWFTERKPGPGLMNAYLLMLLPVMGYVFLTHMDYGFSKDVTTYITKPFFADHTIYSAILVFLAPFALLQASSGLPAKRWFFGAVAVFIVLCIVLASSRAAWLSGGVAILVFMVARMRIPRSIILISGVVTVIIFVMNLEPLMGVLRQNRSDSNARNADLVVQTRSVINVSNDQSNIERLNRWRCAWRMFYEKPFTGFGPGTYQFAYLPFQRDYELTRISVTSPYRILEGRGGTAHNEFLLVLSESGIFAAVCFLFAFIFVFISAFRVCYRLKTGTGLALAMLIALTSFTIHSLFNNFMDTDKAAALVYIAFAFFIAEEIHESNSMI